MTTIGFFVIPMKRKSPEVRREFPFFLYYFCECYFYMVDIVMSFIKWF